MTKTCGGFFVLAGQKRSATKRQQQQDVTFFVTIESEVSKELENNSFGSHM